MKFENAAGRLVETDISGKTFIPFSRGKKHIYCSKVTSLSDALKKWCLKNDKSLSFHHQLRDGDNVVNMTLDVLRDLGVKNMAKDATEGSHELKFEDQLVGCIKWFDETVLDFIKKVKEFN